MADTEIASFPDVGTARLADDMFPAANVGGTTDKRYSLAQLAGQKRNVQTGAYTVIADDFGKTIDCTSGTFTLTLTASATLLNGWHCYVLNSGTGIITIDPNAAETINGLTTMLLSQGDCAKIFTDGTNFFAVGLPGDPRILTLNEIAEPGAPAADTIRLFAQGNNAHLRTKDQHGLIDPITNRDRYRVRKPFFTGLGSDTAASDDSINFGLQFATHEGVFTLSSTTVEGQFKNWPTSATINTDAGMIGGFTMFQRDQNPDMTVKFRVNSTTQRRVWIGFMEADHMASDATAATHKFAMRLSTLPAVTGFTIVHSDGTTETVEAQIQASDTAVHTIRLIADNANTRFGYSFDGAAIVWITTNIPAATAALGIQIQIRCLEAVAKNMDVWFCEGSVEK
jgi:hypothetical protein